MINMSSGLWGYLKTKKYKRNQKSIINSITKHCNNLNSENAHIFMKISEFIDKQKYVIVTKKNLRIL